MAIVHATWRDHVLVLTLDRPARANALDQASLVELASGLEDASAGGARVVVITGGNDTFCGGADMAGLDDGAFTHALTAVLHALGSASAVTVAAVDGAALGAGMQLAMACDLRVATPRSRFAMSSVRHGLAVDAWTVQRAVALLGGSLARSLLLAGEELDADRAHALGFVQRTGGLDVALAWADEVATFAPLSLDAHKTALDRLAWSAPTDADVSETFERAWSSADASEGRAAFIEKRRPLFRGR